MLKEENEDRLFDIGLTLFILAIFCWMGMSAVKVTMGWAFMLNPYVIASGVILWLLTSGSLVLISILNWNKETDISEVIMKRLGVGLIISAISFSLPLLKFGELVIGWVAFMLIWALFTKPSEQTCNKAVESKEVQAINSHQ